MLCKPLPPRSVLNAGGIISITSIFFDFNRCRKDRVNEWKKAFDAQYTGICASGTKDKPDVVLIIVFNDLRLIKREIRWTGDSILISIPLLHVYKNHYQKLISFAEYQHCL